MIDNNPAEDERHKVSKPEKSNGMDWESMGRDVFDMFMLTLFGFTASFILLSVFRLELATPQNAFECGMAYALLIFSFRLSITRR